MRYCPRPFGEDLVDDNEGDGNQECHARTDTFGSSALKQAKCADRENCDPKDLSRKCGWNDVRP